MSTEFNPAEFIHLVGRDLVLVFEFASEATRS